MHAKTWVLGIWEGRSLGLRRVWAGCFVVVHLTLSCDGPSQGDAGTSTRRSDQERGNVNDRDIYARVAGICLGDMRLSNVAG